MKYILMVFLWFWIGDIFSQSNEITGIWLTEDKTAHVQLYIEKGKLFGKIIWLKYPTEPNTKSERKDIENPDPLLRNQPIVGLIMVKGFEKIDHEYRNGTVYDSRDGKIYKGKIWLVDKNTLKMRGYWGMFYKTETWIRVK
jgi:uncharacterized protein (DUF2147 family)